MELELLNYKTSILNPALKWIAPLLFLVAFAMLVQAYNNYGGIFKQAMKVLLFTLGIGVLAFFFRVSGDVILPNFKWGESLFYLTFVILNILVAAKFLRVIREVE